VYLFKNIILTFNILIKLFLFFFVIIPTGLKKILCFRCSAPCSALKKTQRTRQKKIFLKTKKQAGSESFCSFADGQRENKY